MRWAAIGLMLVLAACGQRASYSDPGNTRPVPQRSLPSEDSGIGGTGVSVCEEKEGGIGGTGCTPGGQGAGSP